MHLFKKKQSSIDEWGRKCPCSIKGFRLSVLVSFVVFLCGWAALYSGTAVFLGSVFTSMLQISLLIISISYTPCLPFFSLFPYFGRTLIPGLF